MSWPRCASGGGRCTYSNASRNEANRVLRKAPAGSIPVARQAAAAPVPCRSRQPAASAPDLRSSDRPDSAIHRPQTARRRSAADSCGCTISRPCAPWRTSPKQSTRAPGSNCSACARLKWKKRSSRVCWLASPIATFKLRAITEAALDRFDHAFDLRALADAQIGDGGNAGLVLVAQRQVKPQILYPLQSELRASVATSAGPTPPAH
jgi:hypothetical protein